MEKLYNTLLQLPLFQGITLEDFNDLVGKLKWHFEKFRPGQTILRAQDVCDRVCCILTGSTAATLTSPDETFSITEFSDKPFIIEPYSLYGIENTYRRTYQATTEVTAGFFTKLAFLTIVNEYLICRLNIINILSRRAQMLNTKIWSDTMKKDFQSRLIHFLMMHVESQEGKKVVRIKLYDLASMIGVSHVNTSAALNSLSAENLLSFGRMNITIPDMALLKKKYDSLA